MKKYFILSLAFFPIVVSASFNRDLYYGMRDPEIQELQEFLTDQKVYSGPITGNFFTLTQKAVRDFQTANLISSTGYFGPLTRAKANTLLSAITDEAGAPISPAITAPKTNDDVVAKLTEQIALLQSQLAQLQKNQAALDIQNQKLETQNQTLQVIKDQQASQVAVLGAIQTNTAPPPPPPPPPPAPPPPVIALIPAPVSPPPPPPIFSFIRGSGTLAYDGFTGYFNIQGDPSRVTKITVEFETSDIQISSTSQIWVYFPTKSVIHFPFVNRAEILLTSSLGPDQPRNQNEVRINVDGIKAGPSCFVVKIVELQIDNVPYPDFKPTRNMESMGCK